jgi:hypothetical protein
MLHIRAIGVLSIYNNIPVTMSSVSLESTGSVLEEKGFSGNGNFTFDERGRRNDHTNISKRQNEWSNSIEKYIITLIQRSRINTWMQQQLIFMHERRDEKLSLGIRFLSLGTGAIALVATAFTSGTALTILSTITGVTTLGTGALEQYRKSWEDKMRVPERVTALKAFEAACSGWERELALPRHKRKPATEFLDRCLETYNAIIEFAPEPEEEIVQAALSKYKDDYQEYIPSSGILRKIEPYKKDTIIDMESTYNEEYVPNAIVRAVPEHIVYEMERQHSQT